jgi:hypothetical protein
MSRVNSFTSNSDPAADSPVADAPLGTLLPVPETTGPGRRHVIFDLLLLAGWMVAFLIVLDQGVSLGLKLSITPPKVRSFFNYGHSIQWKMQSLLGPTDQSTPPMARIGWLDSPVLPRPVRKPASDRDPVVTFYGNSFTHRFAHAMIRIEPRVTVCSGGAPNAAPNHSYALFERNPGRARSDVVVLGVLAANVTGVLSRGYTWAFDSPPPYTQPLMKIHEGRLVEEWPVVQSLQEFRKCLFDDQRWKQFSDDIAPSDPFFDHFLFDGSVTDASVICCLVRKAWGQFRRQQVLGRTHKPDGFIRESETIRVLTKLLVKFGTDVRADGVLPIVLLLEASGMEGHLRDAVGDALTAEQVPFISSSDVFRTNDRRNYIPDGHYTEENDEKIVKAILDLMRKVHAGRSPDR